MRTQNGLLGLLAMVFWSGSALAQGSAGPPAASPGQAAGPSEAGGTSEGPPGSSALDDEQAAREREVAMRSYALGAPEEAVNALRRLVVECADSSECSEASEADLMFHLGIALSASPERRADAVRAFRQALVVSPDLELETRWASPEPASCLREARASLPARADEKSGTTAVAPKTVELEEEDEKKKDEEEDEPPPPPEGHVAILAHINVQSGYGGATDSQYQAEDITVGQVGGSLTLAVMPSESRFTIGTRGRLSALFTESGSYFLSGMDILFGSTLGPRRDDNFGYLLFGPGVEYVPQVGDLGASGHAILGWSYRHVSFGAASDFGGAGDYGYFNVGLHLGYGTLR